MTRTKKSAPASAYDWAVDMVDHAELPPTDLLAYWLIHGRTEKGAPKQCRNARERQEELVALTLDTALEATLVRCLMEGQRPAFLMRCGLIKPEAIEYLNDTLFKNIPAHYFPHITKEQALETVRHLRAEQWMAQSSKMVDEATMQRAFIQMQQYVEHRDGQIQNVLAASEGRTPMKAMMMEEVPHDPRIDACLEICGGYFAFRDTGRKNEQSLRCKIQEKNGKTSLKGSGSEFVLGAVRDVNRITIIPRDPQLGECFCELLRDRVLSTRQGEARTFIEPWQVAPHGCVDRKLYVPLAAATEQAPEGVPEVLPGEIKMEGMQMLKADEQSHDCYKFVKKMSQSTGGDFNPQALVQEYEQALQELEPSYVGGLQRQLADFVQRYKNMQVKKHCPTICAWSEKEIPLPDSKEHKEEIKNALIAMEDEARRFNAHLYKHYVKQDDREWLLHYLELMAEKIETLQHDKGHSKKEDHTIETLEEIMGALESRIDRVKQRITNARDGSPAALGCTR